MFASRTRGLQTDSLSLCHTHTLCKYILYTNRRAADGELFGSDRSSGLLIEHGVGLTRCFTRARTYTYMCVCVCYISRHVCHAGRESERIVSGVIRTGDIVFGNTAENRS